MTANSTEQFKFREKEPFSIQSTVGQEVVRWNEYPILGGGAAWSLLAPPLSHESHILICIAATDGRRGGRTAFKDEKKTTKNDVGARALRRPPGRIEWGTREGGGREQDK